jgi:hypothetical protein
VNTKSSPRKTRLKNPGSLSNVTKEWIDSIPKIINSNGCWIPINRPSSNGYVRVKVGTEQLLLHRLALSLYHNINYYDSNIVTRHNANCDKSCFLHTHITPGTQGDNNRDTVLHGKHNGANLTKCPKCGNEYRVSRRKSGLLKGKVYRRCLSCFNESRRIWSRNEKT